MGYKDSYLSGFNTGGADVLSAISGFEPETAGTDAFASALTQDAKTATNILGGAMEGGTMRQIAKMRADEYRRQQSKKTAGGIFNVLGTAASFIPGVGPLVGGAIKGAGSFLG